MRMPVVTAISTVSLSRQYVLLKSFVPLRRSFHQCQFSVEARLRINSALVVWPLDLHPDPAGFRSYACTVVVSELRRDLYRFVMFETSDLLISA